MYLPLPILGYLADIHGPVILTLLSMLMFCPSYFIAALCFQNEWDFRIMVVCYTFIGIGTSSLYFSSMIICAKTFKNYQGLSISGPVACYGLSSLIEAQIIKKWFLKIDTDDEVDIDNRGKIVDVYTSYMFFAILYLITGIFNWISSSVVAIEREILQEDDDIHKPTEQQPLLEGEERETITTDTENRIIKPLELTQNEKLILFLKDKSMWLFMLSFLLSIGPLEMFINNMGTILFTIGKKAPSTTTIVSLHALFSTIARFATGGFSDYFSSESRKTFRLSRVHFQLVAFVIGGIGQYLISNGFALTKNGENFNIIAALNGTSYGILFTIYPTIIASVWGVESIGTNWGMFMIAPAIGSLIYGVLFAVKYDKQNCAGLVGKNVEEIQKCFSTTFDVTFLGFVIAFGVVLFIWRVLWRKRGIPVY